MHHKIARYLAAGTLLITASLFLGYAFGVDDSAAQIPAAVKIPNLKMSQIPQYSLGSLGRKAYTIYMRRGGEKVRAAERMTALHEIMAEKGYTLVDFEPYSENGDLEGWWITYVEEGWRPEAIEPKVIEPELIEPEVTEPAATEPEVIDLLSLSDENGGG